MATSATRSRSTRHAGAGSAEGNPLSSFTSRTVIAIVLLPVVLGAVYLGGWWVFAIVAIAAAVALHEYWLMARSLAPLAPAGYIGSALALVAAELSGVTWMLGGLLSTFAFAFVL